jgi:hypothetical protein
MTLDNPKPKKIPKVFIGSAWKTDLEDMALFPNKWPTVRSKAGYFLQPMGYAAIGASGSRKALLDAFSIKTYVLVMPIGNVEKGIDPLRDYKLMRKNSPEWSCAGAYLYIATKYLWDGYPNMVRQFKKASKPFKDLGIPVYAFVTPVSRDNYPEGVAYGKFMQKGAWWERLVKDIDCDGIAVDFPFVHWLSLRRPPWNTDVWAANADKMAASMKKLGKVFAWSVNGSMSGSTSTKENLALFAKQLKARGTVPDFWLVDHFDGPSKYQPGVPETAEGTTTAGALVLMKY